MLKKEKCYLHFLLLKFIYRKYNKHCPFVQSLQDMKVSVSDKIGDMIVHLQTFILCPHPNCNQNLFYMHLILSFNSEFR